LIVQLDTLETQYQQEQELTRQLLACRSDLSRQADIVALQSQLHLVQHASPLLGWTLMPEPLPQ
jgi:type VI secretion system protein VasG